MCVHGTFPVKVLSLLLLAWKSSWYDIKKEQEKATSRNQHKQIPYFHVNVSSNKNLRQKVIKEQSRKKKKTTMKTSYPSTTTGDRTVPK